MTSYATDAHPLDRAVAALDADIDWVRFRVDTESFAAPPSSHTASKLIGDSEALTAWLSLIHAARTARHGPVAERVAAGDLLQQAADIIAWLGAALLHRDTLVPLASLDGLIVTLDGAGQWTQVTVTDRRFACLASDARAAHPDARPVAHLDELTAALREQATEAGRKFVDAWSPPRRMGSRLRWGAITDALDSAPWAVSMSGDESLGAATSQQILRDAEKPLIAGSRIYRDHDAKGRLFYTRDRHACCFEYLLPETSACFSCPRTSRDERRRRAGDWPDEGPPD